MQTWFEQTGSGGESAWQSAAVLHCTQVSVVVSQTGVAGSDGQMPGFPELHCTQAPAFGAGAKRQTGFAGEHGNDDPADGG